MRACQACGVELIKHRADARYCGDVCRQRARRGGWEARRRDIIRDRLPRPRPVRVMPVVTDKAPILRASKAPSLDPRIVPDAKWPGMFRIGLPGCLSDMANLTRIKDALRHGVRS